MVCLDISCTLTCIKKMCVFCYLGDRIISVNGESVSGKSYAEVVGLIQRLRDNLSLIVVPKQDDILQMVSSFSQVGK